MERQYHKWYSERLERDMELLIFGHSGTKVLVFPTRGGKFYEYENLRMVDQIADKVEQGHLQLFCVDSIDKETFYCSWKHPADRIQRHIRYEKYILEEVIPFMDHINPNPHRIAHGCSLGAFHATNIAFRHPELFVKLCAFSGRFDLTMRVEHFRSLLDDYYDDDVYFHSPSHYLPNLEDDHILSQLRQMDIVFVIGNEDPFLENNLAMSQALWDKNIWHALHRWDGRAHRGRYWREMVKLYL
jgi:esterase/lipase superfamily enzyme